ncbi:MAG: hypothetical protein SPF56_08880, partial [Bacteroidaceae bacterium]|nr:hypothetical protein [Bacteroidaceae bacterium]
MPDKRTAEGVYQALSAISKEEGIDFGINEMTADAFKKKYFDKQESAGALYDKLNALSQEEGIDFGQGTRDEWVNSFDFKPRWKPTAAQRAQFERTMSSVRQSIDKGREQFDSKERRLRQAKSELKEAYAERDRLQKMMDEKGKRLDKVIPTVSFGAGQAFTGGSIKRISDDGFNQLSAAYDDNHERIKTLEARVREEDSGEGTKYMKSAGAVLSDPRTWTNGLNSLKNDITKFGYKRLQEQGKSSEAGNVMMKNARKKEEAEETYGQDLSFWHRAGNITGNMLPFALQIGLTRGIPIASKGVQLTGKIAGKIASPVLSRLTKYVGITASEMAQGLAVANTAGAANTAGEVLRRHMGRVVETEDGKYVFSGGESPLKAFVNGELTQMLEYGTEGLGEHLRLGSRSLKALDKMGAGKVSDFFRKAGKNDVVKATGGLLNRFGIQGYPSEVMEEELNIIGNAILVGDSRISDLWDGKTQKDIWGGMALSLGFMGALPTAGYGAARGYDAYKYHRMEHGVETADRLAAFRLTEEAWRPLKERIDNTTNEHMKDVLEDIIGTDRLQREEKEAALEYVKRSMILRGYNMGAMANARDAAASGEMSESAAESYALDNSYTQGYNIVSPQEMNHAKTVLAVERQRVSGFASDDFLSAADANPYGALEQIRNAEAWSDDERTAVLDYLNAKQVYDGMIQRVRDDIDGRIALSDAGVDARTNKTTGKIHDATMKQGDRKVYVVGGSVMLTDDGSMVDTGKSDERIVVRDAGTGKLEMVSPSDIFTVGQAVDPAVEKERAGEEIRLRYAREAADRIDGVANDTDGTGSVPEGANAPMQADESIPQGAAVDTDIPRYALNDELMLRGEGGRPIYALISDIDADGNYLVYTEEAINGNKMNLFTRSELDNMLVEHNPAVEDTGAEERTEQSQVVEEQAAEVAPQQVQEPVQTVEPQPAQPAEAPAQPTEQPTAEPMPVGEDGEEDWQATTP